MATIKKKICLVGAFAVGKTSLVQQYVHSFFSEKYHSTIGVKVEKKRVAVKQHEIDLIIWDLYGEDEFQTVRMSYLRGAAGCLYVVDGTRRATLDVMLDLRTRVEQNIGRIPCILLLNKEDLQSQWELDSEEERLLVTQGVAIMRTSAKTGHSVEEAFYTLAELMLEDQRFDG